MEKTRKILLIFFITLLLGAILSSNVKAAKTVKIVFNGNGGTGVPANKTITLKKQFTMPSTKPQRTNCTFIGWSTNKNYVQTEAYKDYTLYKPNTNYTIKSVKGDTLNLYAIWQWNLLPSTEIYTTAKKVGGSDPNKYNPYYKSSHNAYCLKFKKALDTKIYSGSGKYPNGSVALYHIQRIRGAQEQKSYLKARDSKNSNKTYYVTGGGTNFKVIGYKYVTNLTYKEYIATIYSEIMSGYPVAVKVRNSVNQEIYVVAYGINASANVKKGIIKASDIYVLDTTNLHWNKLSDFRYASDKNIFSLGIYSSHNKATGFEKSYAKNARFSAYYPNGDSMEGGYTDCKGIKLDPSKNTCAAPSCIPYGTKIFVNGTGTYVDGRIYTVNDRGGKIYVQDDGYYRIDILMSNASTCNSFGVKKGTITILK